jgi:hypothetical protein
MGGIDDVEPPAGRAEREAFRDMAALLDGTIRIPLLEGDLMIASSI